MNVGIDLVNFKRKEFKSLKHAKRWCTENELHYYFSKPTKIAKQAYLASLWAIKEAILKATNKAYSIQEIDVHKTDIGSRVFLAHHEIKISVSYQDKYVVAVAIATEKRRNHGIE